MSAQRMRKSALQRPRNRPRFGRVRAAFATSPERQTVHRRGISDGMSMSAVSPHPAARRIRDQSAVAECPRTVRRMSASRHCPRTGRRPGISTTNQRTRTRFVPSTVSATPRSRSIRLCPRLTQPPSDRRSRNSRRAGHRSSRNCPRQGKSSSSFGRSARPIGRLPNC